MAESSSTPNHIYTYTVHSQRLYGFYKEQKHVSDPLMALATANKKALTTARSIVYAEHGKTSAIEALNRNDGECHSYAIHTTGPNGSGKHVTPVMAKVWVVRTRDTEGYARIKAKPVSRMGKMNQDTTVVKAIDEQISEEKGKEERVGVRR